MKWYMHAANCFKSGSTSQTKTTSSTRFLGLFLMFMLLKIKILQPIICLKQQKNVSRLMCNNNCNIVFNKKEYWKMFIKSIWAEEEKQLHAALS